MNSQSSRRSQRFWIGACRLDDDNEPRSNFFNACVGLREDQDLLGAFAFNEMTLVPYLLRSIPGLNGSAAYPRAIGDTEILALQHFLQDAGLDTVGYNIVHDAARHIANENAFHPVRDYLNSLVWDGTLRLASWLHTYVGCPDDEYHRVVGSCFLTGMVARIFQPGCKMDYMLVLEGPQGALKSTVARILGGDYYSDGLPDLGGDDVRISQHMRGKWLVEVSELSAFSRADTSKLKAFISRQSEDYIPKYGRAEAREARQGVLIGTTNKPNSNGDETGARRFWYVIVGTILIDRLAADRDQLFAEAVHAFRSGAQWWPDPLFEEQTIKPEQDRRLEPDAWEELVLPFLETLRAQPLPRVTLWQIADQALLIEKSRFGRAEQLRIAAILQANGWTKGARNMHARPWIPKP